jgi:hypothetical protein
MDAPAPTSRLRSPALAAVAKLLFGVAVFTATVGGWAAVQHRNAMHTPLPDAGGRQGACALWFVGSSSFARWSTIGTDMGPWIVHNRGVGGAFLPELIQRFANEGPVTPPQAIVFYAGDNDIAKGKDPATAAREFREFVAVKMARMPDVPMLTLSVKPSPKRWAMRPVQHVYDVAMQQTAARTPNLLFVDATSGLLVNGRPGPFFIEDGIHMNAVGYRVWAAVVRTALLEALPRTVVEQCTSRHGRP